MEDSFIKVVMIFVGSIFLFVVPLTVYAQRYDAVRQVVLDDAVVEFVDNARASGEITPEAYRKMCKKIDNAHKTCHIEIRYATAYESPDSVTPAGTWSVKRYLDEYNTTDILGYMFPAQPASGIYGDERSYKLKEGGFLSVEVNNVTPTVGAQMMRLFIPSYTGHNLHTSYSGYVGNTAM